MSEIGTMIADALRGTLTCSRMFIATRTRSPSGATSATRPTSTPRTRTVERSNRPIARGKNAVTR
jgi:hypothetical protein